MNAEKIDPQNTLLDEKQQEDNDLIQYSELELVNQELEDKVKKQLQDPSLGISEKVYLSNTLELYKASYEAYTKALQGLSFIAGGTNYTSQNLSDVERSYKRNLDALLTMINQQDRKAKLTRALNTVRVIALK